MARAPMVTRTITTTKVKVLCVDITKEQIVTKEVVLPRTYKDDAHLLKAVEKVVNTDECKATLIVGTEVVETLYGMSEQKFIETAEILPPRGTKADTENEEEND